MGLAACTAANPAFEDDGGGSPSGPTSTSDEAGPTSTPTDDPPVDTETAGGSTVTTSSGGNDGVDEAGTTEEPEDVEPPTVGPYGEPERLSINHPDPMVEDDDPTLTEDQLELYFARRNGGDDDIWVATRESVVDDWDAPVEVTELNTVHRENTPEVSLDGRTMFFSSTRESFADEDVFVAVRRARDQPWEMIEPVSEINTDGRDVCPFVLPNGREMFLCTGPELELDLVHFVRSNLQDEWMGPSSLMGINDPTALDCGAWVEQGARVVVFFSYRSMDQSDLWVTSRATGEGPFEPPVRVEGVNSEWFDDDPWLSQSGDVIYFASDRPGRRQQDIFMARRIDG